MNNLQWVKSSRSYDLKNLKCVEVARAGNDRVLVRDSKCLAQTPLSATQAAWDGLLSFVKQSTEGHTW